MSCVRGRYRILRRGGGCDTGMDTSISYLDILVAGQIMQCMDKMAVDKTPVKNAREEKMLAILRDREGKMPILSKHFIYHTDG